jgi:hypothetical protein
MSRKSMIPRLVIAEDQSLEADYVSPPIRVQGLDNISFQINITGAAEGSFSVQVSNDVSFNPDGSVRDPGTWTALTSPAAVAVTAGAPSPIFFDVNQTSAYAIRLSWTNNASPESSASIYLTAKAV